MAARLSSARNTVQQFHVLKVEGRTTPHLLLFRESAMLTPAPPTRIEKELSMKPARTVAYLNLLLLCNSLSAQVPQIISYQGRVAVKQSNFDGVGQFKFSLVTGNGTVTLWSNDGSGRGGAEPTAI